MCQFQELRMKLGFNCVSLKILQLYLKRFFLSLNIRENCKTIVTKQINLMKHSRLSHLSSIHS